MIGKCLKLLVGVVIGYLASMLVQPVTPEVMTYVMKAPRILMAVPLGDRSVPMLDEMLAELRRTMMVRAWAGVAIGGVLGWCWMRVEKSTK